MERVDDRQTSKQANKQTSIMTQPGSGTDRELSGEKLERDNLFYLLFTFRRFVNKQLLLFLFLFFFFFLLLLDGKRQANKLTHQHNW